MDPNVFFSITDNGVKDIGILGQLLLSYSAPKNIKKKAQAEVDSYYIKISALTGLSKEEIVKITRNNTIELLELVKGNNLKNVLSLTNEISTIDIEKIQNTKQDWLHKFINYASFISDQEVQLLWARILTGELNQHGSYSLQTMNVLSMLDKNLVGQLGKILNYCCTIDEKIGIFYHPDSLKNSDPIIINNDLLIEFESLGIIKRYFDFASCKFIFENDDYCILKYGTNQISVKPKRREKNHFYINLGRIELTKIGKELYTLYNQDFVARIFNHIKLSLVKENYEIFTG